MRKTLMVVLAALSLVAGSPPASASNGLATDPYEALGSFDIAWIAWSNTNEYVYLDVRSHVPFGGAGLKSLTFSLYLDGDPGPDVCIDVRPGRTFSYVATAALYDCEVSGFPLEFSRWDSGHLRVAVPIAVLRPDGLGSRTSYKFVVHALSNSNQEDIVPDGWGATLTHDLAPEYRGCGPLGALDAKLWSLSPAAADALCGVGR